MADKKYAMGFVEDELQKAALIRLVEFFHIPLEISHMNVMGGIGKIKSDIAKYNSIAASGYVCIVIVDLNSAYECAPALKAEWFPKPFKKHKNFIFRIAVREIEAWLLLDKENFAEFLGIPCDMLPLEPEKEKNPKELVIALSRKSKFRHIRSDIPPALGTTAKIGPNYNDRLAEFVFKKWNPECSRNIKESLPKAITALRAIS